MTLNNGNDVKMKIDPNDPRLTGYALGALTPDALQGLEGELVACPASRAHAEELQATAALLGEVLAAEPVTTLTAEQRAAVFAELGGPAVPAVTEVPAAPRAAEHPSSRRGWTRDRAEQGPRVRIFSAVLAAAAVLLMLGGLAFVILRDSQERPRPVAGGSLEPEGPGGDQLGPPPAGRVGGSSRRSLVAPARRPVAGSSSTPKSRLAPKHKKKGKLPASVNRLTAAHIRTVMLSAMPAVRHCSAKYSGEGLLKVRIKVQPTGKPEAQILGRFDGTPVGYCILGALYPLRFPRFTGAAVTFVYPYRIVAGKPVPRPKPLPESKAMEQGDLAAAKQLLAKAQNAYVAGNHHRAVQLCKQVMQFIPGHYKAVQILGASSCYLREAKDAQWAYDRVAVSYRPLLKKVCQNNGIDLR